MLLEQEWEEKRMLLEQEWEEHCDCVKHTAIAAAMTTASAAAAAMMIHRYHVRCRPCTSEVTGASGPLSVSWTTGWSVTRGTRSQATKRYKLAVLTIDRPRATRATHVLY